jgi:YVTN family beta-propeller protein
VIDTKSLAVEAIKVGRGPIAIAISPDGRHAYVANARDDSVSVINTATNKPAAKPIEVGHRPTAIAITPDGRHVYVVKN